LKGTFKGLFAILDIGKQILGGVFTALGHLLGAVGDGSGGILDFTSKLGGLIVKLDEWLKKGDKIKTFFAGLGDVLGVPLTLIGKLTGALAGLFGGGDKTSGAAKSLSGMSEGLKPATKAVEAATAAWEAFLAILGEVGKIAKPIVDALATALGNIGKTIADALNNQNFDSVFTVIQTGLIAGI